MADDPDRDLIPSRDVKGSYISQNVASAGSSDILGTERSTLLERKIAEQLSRNNLEDQLYHLKDENLELKKTSRKQEEQLKKLATKLSRLIAEKKKLEVNSSPGRKRDIEMEEAMEELHDKVRNLEKNNIQLREKLLVAKQQVITQARRPNPYPHVQAKVNSGRPRSGISTYVSSSHVRASSAQTNLRKSTQGPLPTYVMQLLDEARNELFNLKELVSSQKNDIDMYEQEVEILKERLRMKDAEFSEEVAALKVQITDGQRQHVQENLDLIRLHRELKQRDSKLIALQAQVADSEERLKAQRASYDRLTKEIEEKNIFIQEEQKKSLELFTELQKSKAALLPLEDLQESLKSIRKENDVLKETNEKLINSVIGQDKERSSHSAEQSLRDQISHLESSLNSELKSKEVLEENLIAEKEKCSRLDKECKELQDTFSEMKNQLAEMESKLNILKSEDVDFDELGEALALVKLKKQHSIKMNFMGDMQIEDTESDLRSKFEKAERDHTETVKELNGVREMLMTQYKINKDCQEEVRALTQKLEQQEREYQTKLEEYSNLLDLRASRIQKLEKQLNDIAYGTKKFKIKDYKDEYDDIETLDLGRGENIFEIHIKKFVYSEEGINFLKNKNPSSFMTWNFYEFQLQSTPVIKGKQANFDSTSQYKVKMDDFFLFYLHKNHTTIELHESFGTDYRTVAACQLNFSEIFEQPQCRLHGMQDMICVCDTAKGIVFGTLHYWVRFKVGVEEAFRLYKERLKALKYIQSNEKATASAVRLLNKSPERNPSMNELHVKIIRCTKLKGKQEDSQPSPFCIYKLYDLPDQDTIIIPSSSSPEFSDHRTFPFCVDNHLEKYLKTQCLEIFVFDDDDSDATSFIGQAIIPLFPLSQGKHIKGLFQLQKNNQNSCGSIEISIYWQHPYVSPSVSIPECLEKPIEYPAHLKPEITIESELEESSIEPEDEFDYSKKVVPVPKPRKRLNSSKPLMNSTPRKESSSDRVIISDNSNREQSASNAQKSIEANVSENDSSASESDTTSQSVAEITEPKYLNSADKGLDDDKPSVESPDQDNTVISPERNSRKKLISSTTNEPDSDDTVAGKPQEMSFEEMSDDDNHALSLSETSSSSEAEVKTTISVETHTSVQSHAIPGITVGIWHLTLKPGSSALNDPNIQMLYVEYRFLDYPLEEMETPFSLPKPIPPDVVTYGYQKVFPFDPKENREKYRLLSDMFNPDMPEASWIKFTVVSEPPTDEEDLECDDVGYAYVDLREILRYNKDVVEKNLIIYDAKDNETEIGKLNVTVQALEVLQLLQGMV